VDLHFLLMFPPSFVQTSVALLALYCGGYWSCSLLSAPLSWCCFCPQAHERRGKICQYTDSHLKMGVKPILKTWCIWNTSHIMD